MQSLEEVESICYQNILDQAEAYMNEQDREPTAEESYTQCVHAAACRRAHIEGRKTCGCGYTKEDETEDGGIWVPLACDECEEYEE